MHRGLGFNFHRNPAPGFAHRPGVWSGAHRLVENPPTPGGVSSASKLEFFGLDAYLDWPERLGHIAPLPLRVGTLPSFDQNVPWLGPSDGAVLGSGDGYYRADNTTDGDIEMSDLWVRILVRVAVSRTIFAKRNGGIGYQIGFNASPALYLTIQDVSGSATIASDSLVAGDWILADIILNRDEASADGGRIYVNGLPSGSGVDCSARQGSLDAALSLSLLADSGGGSSFNEALSFVGIYWGDNWLRSGSQGQRDAATQHKIAEAVLSGSQPMVSWAGDGYAAAQGSTSSAFQRKTANGAATLYRMSAGAPRFESSPDSNGLVFTGALVEAAATNKCLQSQNFASIWVPTNLAVAATPISCPNGRTLTTVTLHENGTAGVQHYLTQGSLSVTSGVSYVISQWVKAAGRSWIVFGSDHGLGYFNVSGSGSTGLLVGSGTNKASGIENCGNGWFRCWVTWTSGSTGLVACYNQIAQGNGVVVFDGQDQDSLYVFGYQFEVDKYPSSYVPTTTAAATRAADSLYYGLANTVGDAQGAVRFRFLFPPNYPQASGVQNTLIELTNADGSNRFTVYKDNGQSGIYQVSQPDNVSGGPAPSVIDNRIHEGLLTWLGNRLELWIDGSLFTRTMVSVPTGLSRLYVGSSIALAPGGPALVGDIKVFNTYLASWHTPGSGFRV